MIKRKNQIRGLVAKRAGQGFEQQFQNTCGILGIECVRIPDGCRQNGPMKLLRVRTPFDFVLGYKHRSAFIDLKSSQSERFNYSQIVPHQLKELMRLSSCGRSGYVIAFSSLVYFFEVTALAECKPGTSLDINDGFLLGDRFSFDARKIFT